MSTEVNVFNKVKECFKKCKKENFQNNNKASGNIWIKYIKNELKE